MDVSIILVNYKSAQLVLDCIHSIYEQSGEHSFEVIVVDNNSQDNCKELVMASFPGTKFLALDYNAGFARANNAGMKIALGDHILILNTDTIILDHAIDRSISLLRLHDDAVGCGVQLLNTDGSPQISGAHFITGGLNILLPLPYLGRLIRWLGYRFKSTIPSVQTVEQTISVDWIVGAYILVRRTVLEKTGLMDEDFFMYSEEIEWCARLRKYGRLLLFPGAKVIHIGGGTSGEYYGTNEQENGKNLWDKKGRQIVVSSLLRIRKQFGLTWYLLMISIHLLEIPVFFICLSIDKMISGKHAMFHWKNLSGYISNVRVLMRYLPKMVLNKPHFYKV